MRRIDFATDEQWLPRALKSLKYFGFAQIENVLSLDEIDQLNEAAGQVQASITHEVGRERLEMARNAGSGEWRLILAYHDAFLQFLDREEMRRLVDSTLGETSILRFQNLEDVPSNSKDSREWNQNRYHMNTPRVIRGHLGAIDILYSLEDSQFNLVPGTHQQEETPDVEFLEWAETLVEVPQGSILMLDATLWHREAVNRSGTNRRALTHQFTKSYIKPHFDYPRALGEEKIRGLPERVQAMLGWHTRIPCSLDEFYVAPEERLYRGGQG